MYDAFIFDLQVRYALGYRNLGDGEFELRTTYNFRQRLSDHMQTTGVNLLDQAFAKITDEQIQSFQLKTGRLRMDSTQIASNIRQMTRLQLLVEDQPAAVATSISTWLLFCLHLRLASIAGYGPLTDCEPLLRSNVKVLSVES